MVFKDFCEVGCDQQRGVTARLQQRRVFLRRASLAVKISAPTVEKAIQERVGSNLDQTCEP